jgi:hypothetical protein
MIQLQNIERSYKTGAGHTWVLRRINLSPSQIAVARYWEADLVDTERAGGSRSCSAATA